ncbi:protein of unknown function [Moritella yayanosii]|uniref:Uncharacterized protein n=1 Tax=Moritella yayanosii TaxID=69539 RepID=A0A330LKW0_9GAMM|nr:protein of unknown function [Moritella yayanosii]
MMNNVISYHYVTHCVLYFQSTSVLSVGTIPDIYALSKAGIEQPSIKYDVIFNYIVLTTVIPWFYRYGLITRIKDPI